ncbi:hypothetical protein H2200_004990 [Cladophialophora chaetospira]|uniref:BTB domain-containing protein n=1 Tax=Cladophialophora chaetospira TaxID=386627 RepID=A0AA39CJG6_9EURO|nr:hypothetical protein H2200_004990 [Cladophialophora chaetospira]
MAGNGSDNQDGLFLPKTSTKRKAKAMEPEGDEQQEQDDKEERVAELVEVVPGGDALFKVGKGEGALDIRVSSVVVSLASEVFSKMLSGGFLEAQTKTIILPEDDPKTILTFCQIIHHKLINSTHLLSSERHDLVCKLVAMADMRCCAPALRLWILNEIHLATRIFDHKDWIHHVDFAEWDDCMDFDLEEIINISAVLKHDELFYKATRAWLALIFPGDNDEPSIDPVVPTPTTPEGDNVMAISREAQDITQRRFVDAIFDWIDYEFASDPPEKERGGTFHCQWHIVGYLTHELADHSISAGRKFRCLHSISAMAEELEAICEDLRTEQVKDSLTGSGCTLELDGRRCSYCSRNFADELFTALKGAVSAIPGICLKCFLETGKSVFRPAEGCENEHCSS